MERFDGKKVIECQVSDGINKADELIKKALAGDAPDIRQELLRRRKAHQQRKAAELDIRYIHSL